MRSRSGSRPAATELFEVRTVVERETDPTARVGHRPGIIMIASVQVLDQETVVTKEGRHVLDVGARGLVADVRHHRRSSTR